MISRRTTDLTLHEYVIPGATYSDRPLSRYTEFEGTCRHCVFHTGRKESLVLAEKIMLAHLKDLHAT